MLNDAKSLQEEISNELTYHIKDPEVFQILPNLFLGNYAMALNMKKLEELHITHILNCAIGLKNFYEKTGKFSYLYIPLYDAKTERLEKYLESTNNFIEKGTEGENKILVHCGAGVSRSVSIIMMYLIMKKGYTFESAKKLMVEKRGGARPNEGFENQLREKTLEIHKKF